MNRFRIFFIVLLCISVAILVVNIGLNYWIAKQLPVIINEKNDSPYQITYEDLSVSLLSRGMIATNIVLVPKGSMGNESTKAGIYGKIASVEVRRFQIFDLIFTDKLKAKSIHITKPEVIIYKQTAKAFNDPKSIRSKVIAPFQKIILVSEVEMTEGDLKMLYVKENEPILHVNNLSLFVNGIVITDEILEQKIPFAFNQYDVKFDSIFYRPSPTYDVRAGKLHTVNGSLSLENISYIPRVSRSQFVSSIALEKDLFTLKAKKLQIDSLDWGFRDDNFFFYSKAVTIDEAAANIYRPKMPEDDLSKKHLYSKQLRDLPFDLKVDKLMVRHSTLQYEEEKTTEAGPGQLSFNALNLTARNINSGFGKDKIPDLTIAINCRFMNVSKMDVRWTFNVLNKSDAFNIKGSIHKFPAEQLTPFVKPYMNVTAEGMLDKIYFNFSGNDAGANGDLALEYEDLKVTILRKDREKKNKVLSAIANLFVKKDTKERLKETPVEVDRIPHKSFFNLLWRTIADGLKKLLI